MIGFERRWRRSSSTELGFAIVSTTEIALHGVDHSELTTIAAANVFYDLLGLLARQQRDQLNHGADHG